MNDDLISRSDLKKAIETYDKFACLPDCKLEPFRNLEYPEMFEPYVHLRDILNAIDKAPTVEERPQSEWISGFKYALDKAFSEFDSNCTYSGDRVLQKLEKLKEGGRQ